MIVNKITVDGTTIWRSDLVDDIDREFACVRAVLTQELNKAGSLTLAIPSQNLAYNSIHPMQSVIKVYQDGERIFKGRALDLKESYYKIFTCEGCRNYLLDSVLRPYRVTTSVTNSMVFYLNQHNSQVEAEKQFRLGSVTVRDSNDYIVRSNSNYSYTLSELDDKFVNNLGGYLMPRVEVEDGVEVEYLDYLAVSGGNNNQTLEFGVNISDFEKYVTSENVYTVLVPLGAKIEDEETGETTRLTIEEVNDGNDYIESAEGIALYGRIVKYKEWDNVTVAANLLSKGQADLSTAFYESLKLTLNAVDLKMLGVNVDKIKLGEYNLVHFAPLGINAYFQCTKIKLDLLDPSNNEYVFGYATQSLTSKISSRDASIKKEIQEISKIPTSIRRIIDSKIENATDLLTGVDGGYVLIDRDANGQPWRILIMDSADINTAVNIIQLNQAGIGFSTSGINGPYTNAWTIDGNLVASFITAAELITGHISGWTITQNRLYRNSVLTVDNVEYVYQVSLQSVGDESGANNFLYVRRYPASQDEPADASGWEYLLRIDKYGNLIGQRIYAPPSIQSGRVNITPTAANTPTSVDITFANPMYDIPRVVATPATDSPGTAVLGVGVTNITKTGFKLWLTCATTTARAVLWIANSY